MRNAKKTLSLVMTAVFTTFTVLSGIPAGAATAAQAKAQVAKATAALVKVEKTVKVSTFAPATATTQLNAAKKEVAKVKSLGKAYAKTYTALNARVAKVAKSIANRNVAIAQAKAKAAAIAKVKADAEKAVVAAEAATNGDDVDLVGNETALANAQAAVTAALELIVKLDPNSSDYKGLMARVEAANNTVMDAIEEIKAQEAAKAKEEADKKAAEEAAKVLAAAIEKAEASVKAVEAAPMTTLAEIDAALALGVKAADDVKAVTDTEKVTLFTARLKAVADKGTAVKTKLEEDAKAAAEAKKPATVKSISAVDGVITINFDKKPITTPAAADFVVTKVVTTTAAVTTTVTGTVAVVSDTAVTITVPVVAPVVGQDQTVVYSVVYNATGAAVAAPAITIAKLPTVGVKTLTALNARQIKIEFNKAVDDTTLIAANVKVYIGSATTATTWTADVATDKKSVVLGLDASIPQDTDVKVTIESVADAVNAKELITGYSATAHMVDVTAPEVKGIAMTTSKTATITVSEPLSLETGADGYHVLTNITVDGVKLVALMTQNYATNKITVQFGSSLSVGEHTFVISGYKDFAGFVAKDFTGKATVVADTTAPTVTAVTATSKSVVKVTFSEPVSSMGTITVGGVAYTTGTANADKTVYTINLTTPLTLASIVEETLTYVGTVDMEGNTVSTAKTFTFKISDDTTVPTATIALNTASGSVNGLIITFSKTMSNPGTVTVKDSTGVTKVTGVAPQLDTTDTSNKVYKITAANAGLASVGTAGNYTVTLTGAKDDTVRTNALADTTMTVAAKDVVAPFVTKALLTTAQVGTTTNSKVTLFFNEAMDTTTLSNLANYTVSLNGTSTPVTLSTVTDAAAAPATDGKSVVLTIPNLVDATSKIYALVLKDIAGNVLAATPSTGFGFNSAMTVNSAAGYLNLTTVAASTYAQLTAKNTIKIKFNNPMSVVDPSEFTVKTSTGTLYVGIAASIASDRQTVTLTMSGNLNANAQSGSITTPVAVALCNTTGTAVNTKDIYGGTFVTAGSADYSTFATGKAIVDAVSPTVTAATGTTAGAIDLTFNEVVGTTSTGLANDLVIRDADGAIVDLSTLTIEYYDAAGASSSYSSFKTVTIKGLTTGANYSVTLLGRAVKDAATNVVNDLAATTIAAK